MALQTQRGGRGGAERRVTEFEERITVIANTVAGRFARGSIPLQTKRALTEKRLNEERDALRQRRT